MTVRIVIGDCREKLRDLADESVHTCVTSPPYFGLRDYGVEGQIGLEDSLEAFIAAMVSVFREVRRVLRPDGTLWLNLGDSYAGSWGAQGKRETPGEISRNSVRNHPKRARHTGTIKTAGLKPKDLMGVPWRVAFALQADGWWLRQDIIWHKPNPMPESIKDRCTKAHEYVFLLSKSERYFFDAEAISEPASPDAHARYARGRSSEHKWADRGPGGQTIAKSFEHMATKVRSPKTLAAAKGSRNNLSFVASIGSGIVDRRNKRSVWPVPTEAFPEAHFATYPPALIEPCILAGSPTGGCVLDPFGGAGTTGLVAAKHGRDAILIELNPEYADIADRRLRAGLAQVEGEPTGSADDLPLFAGEAA